MSPRHNTAFAVPAYEHRGYFQQKATAWARAHASTCPGPASATAASGGEI
ncbi:hypothetical protein O3S80_17000 [Streptomyces sp. Lzd4kr]|nr:hypothetical protein [Streptomyces sp. Lzd4kr]